MSAVASQRMVSHLCFYRIIYYKISGSGRCSGERFLKTFDLADICVACEITPLGGRS